MSVWTLLTDLEKVVNLPQAENSELYNILKDEQKYVYQMMVWHDGNLKSWLAILNKKSSPLNFEF